MNRPAPLRLAVIALTAVFVAACGKESSAPKEAPKSAEAGTHVEKPEAPDVHGMPGMSELFKDKKAEEKK